MKRLILLLLLVTAAVLLTWQYAQQPADPLRHQSQSYAGLGETGSGKNSADSFAQARPGSRLTFPQDHGPHSDYRIEWWYLTANLKAEDGRPFGVQWTLFRQALAPDDRSKRGYEESPQRVWQSRQLWMAHAALSTPHEHFFAERFARGMTLPENNGQAGVNAAPFSAWIDNWSLEAKRPTEGFEQLIVNADGDNFGYRLELIAEGPLVRHGQSGFSQKSADGQGSMYYSQPFFRVTGEVVLDGEPIEVSGRAWLDREWSSQLLGPTQSGWDWFSLHLDSGDKLMAFRLRGGTRDDRHSNGHYLSGSWISAEGEVTPLSGDELRLTPLEHSDVAGRRLPTIWRVEVPRHGLDVEVLARHPNQWMGTSFAYWEGMVTVEGSQAGEGYLEMTGY